MRLKLLTSCLLLFLNHFNRLGAANKSFDMANGECYLDQQDYYTTVSLPRNPKRSRCGEDITSPHTNSRLELERYLIFLHRYLLSHLVLFLQSSGLVVPIYFIPNASKTLQAKISKLPEAKWH